MTDFNHAVTDQQVVSSARQQMRAPLHRIISYAEVIVEEENSAIHPQIDTAASLLRSTCEAILHQIDAYLVPPQGDSECLHVLLQAVALQSLSMEAVVSDLAAAAARSSSTTLAADVVRIRKTIDVFDEVVKKLSQSPAGNLDPTAQLPKNTGGMLGPKPAQPLIISIVYQGLLLVVDDDEGNRDVLSRRLLREGYEVMFAESGKHALRLLRRYSFDLVFLDITMPEMDGIAVLSEMKRDPALQNLPVVMVTAIDEIDTIAQCIEIGADDYLLKPINPVLLRARTHALLERKRLQDDRERRRAELEAALEAAKREHDHAERLLLNILPPLIAQELKECGLVKPLYFEDVTIVFADIAGFTRSTQDLPADELVAILHEFFTACDNIMSRYGLEKLKTIGDCYMYAGGIPVRSYSHPVDSVLAAFEMLEAMQNLAAKGQVNWQLRIGMHTGPVIAGVVGIHKFAFDIWGDAVNLTSRLQAHGMADRINLSANTHNRIKDFFACDARGLVAVKEGREIEMFFVKGLTAGLLNKKLSGLNLFRNRYTTYFRKDLAAHPAFLFSAPEQDQNGALVNEP